MRRLDDALSERRMLRRCLEEVDEAPRVDDKAASDLKIVVLFERLLDQS